MEVISNLFQWSHSCAENPGQRAAHLAHCHSAGLRATGLPCCLAERVPPFKLPLVIMWRDVPPSCVTTCCTETNRETSEFSVCCSIWWICPIQRKQGGGECMVERKYIIPFLDRLIPKAGFTDTLILTNPSLEIFYVQNSLLPPFNVMRFHNEVQIQSGRGRGHVALTLICLTEINNVVSFPGTRWLWLPEPRSARTQDEWLLLYRADFFHKGKKRET